ncbi:MAG TPA: hypothetical protein VLE97_10630 [Gaiellaceae bacterium]|nr:hypothetical protein [Gaiellaceae bacterium]
MTTTTTREPHPHQLTPEEQAADTARAPLNAAKKAAHDAYLAANRAIAQLDETADPAWIAHAESIREHAWQLYTALVSETEW